jgi:hypothetical protein
VREVEVLRMIAPGYTSGQIAEQRYLSVRTVESHRASIQHKLRRTMRPISCGTPSITASSSSVRVGTEAEPDRPRRSCPTDGDGEFAGARPRSAARRKSVMIARSVGSVSAH